MFVNGYKAVTELLPEVAHNGATHVQADQLVDEEADGPEGAAVQVQDGVTDSAHCNDTEKHRGDECTGFGEQVQGANHDEDRDVFQIILVGSERKQRQDSCRQQNYKLTGWSFV